MYLNADCSLSKTCIVDICAWSSKLAGWGGSVIFSSTLGLQQCWGSFHRIAWWYKPLPESTTQSQHIWGGK